MMTRKQFRVVVTQADPEEVITVRDLDEVISQGVNAVFSRSVLIGMTVEVSEVPDEDAEELG